MTQTRLANLMGLLTLLLARISVPSSPLTLPHHSRETTMLSSSRSHQVLYVHQQVFQALIKIYSLVDCPIYSVVKYRPR